MAKQIFGIFEKNRWSILFPVIGLTLWIYTGIACTPVTKSPINDSRMVNSQELQMDYDTWKIDCESTIKKFVIAANDIKYKQEQLTKIENTLLTISSGTVTNLNGLISLLAGSGIIGLFADNIRKNGVINGLKINVKGKH